MSVRIVDLLAEIGTRDVKCGLNFNQFSCSFVWGFLGIARFPSECLYST
jgi:hypothetical protein